MSTCVSFLYHQKNKHSGDIFFDITEKVLLHQNKIHYMRGENQIVRILYSEPTRELTQEGDLIIIAYYIIMVIVVAILVALTIFRIT